MDRILVTEQIGEQGLARLQESAQVDLKLKLMPDELKRILPEYDALVVRSQTKVNAEVLQAGTKLRVVGRAGTGVDNIDVDAATRQGIMVVNAPASNSVAVAELTIGMLLALARHIPQAQQSLQAGRWERTAYMGWEVRGKTLGLVGLGRIGAEVARRAHALEMDILAYDPFISHERAAQLGVRPATLDELVAQADIISIHVPMTDGTRNLFDAERMSKMKRGSYLINCSRGGLVDEEALLEALNSGHLAGAALDVFASEPPKPSPLLEHPKVVLTPHLGASTLEAQALTAADVAEGVLDALAGRSARYAVNTPFVPQEEWGVLGPYVELGRTLGKLATQLVESPAAAIELEYLGDLSGMTTAPVRLAVLRGLLEGSTDVRVTAVNAPMLARERGLHISERHQPEGETYASMLRLKLTCANNHDHIFSGTVLLDAPHITQVDSYWVALEPTASMLFTFHRDRPGLIGRVGSILGEADINISAMYVGRRAPRAEAMMVLTLDEPVPEAVIEKICEHEDIERAAAVLI